MFISFVFSLAPPELSWLVLAGFVVYRRAFSPSKISINTGPSSLARFRAVRSAHTPITHCPLHSIGILDELDPSERKLFSDNIRRLDKRIHQGMTKLTWSSKGKKQRSTGSADLLIVVDVFPACPPFQPDVGTLRYVVVCVLC